MRYVFNIITPHALACMGKLGKVYRQVHMWTCIRIKLNTSTDTKFIGLLQQNGPNMITFSRNEHECN